MKPRIVFFGTPDFVVPIVQNLFDTFELVGIVTAPDSLDSHKKILTPSPVKKFATDHSLPIFTFEQFNNQTIKQLSSLNPDLFVVAAYGRIIPLKIINLPPHGSLNVHPSLLPKYRGTSPIQNALINGDSLTGVSIIKMDEKMDHGPILSQWEKPIAPTDTYATLHHLLFKDAAEKLPDIISEYIDGKLTPKEQNEAEATYCQKIKKEDGYFTTDSPPSPEVLDRMIRAYYPWPTAWTKVKIRDSEEKIVKLYPEGKIQMEGKNIVTVKEFLNGYPELKQLLERLLPQ